MSSHSAFDVRMKSYEQVFTQVVPSSIPMIIRIDGRAFHTWTRGLQKPFDPDLEDTLDFVANQLLEEIPGAALALVQSDEISIVAVPTSDVYQHWFGGKVQKIASVTASFATAQFISYATEKDYFYDKKFPTFNARAYGIASMSEVANYIFWRYSDGKRNAISMTAEQLISSSKLHRMALADRMTTVIEATGVSELEYETMIRERIRLFSNDDQLLASKMETACSFNLGDDRLNCLLEYIAEP